MQFLTDLDKSTTFFVQCIVFFSKLRGVEKIVAPPDFKVLIIGSGVSGICMGKKLNDVGIKYTILEKSANLGNQNSLNMFVVAF